MESFLGLGAAFASSLTWAVGVIAFTPLSKRHPAYIINLHRILLALPAFLIILLIRGDFFQSFSSIGWHQVSWAVIAVFASYAFGDVLFLMATKRIGAPAALAIASTYPVLSALGGWAFRGEALRATQSIGILVVIFGTISVILAGAKNEATLAPVQRLQDLPRRRSRWRGEYGVGVMLAFATTLCWALNTVAISEVGQGLDAVTLNALRLAIALVLCPAVGLLMHGRKSFVMIPAKNFVPIIPIFAIEAIGGPFLYVYGLSHSPLAIGAALTSLAPVISVPLALLLGHEKFSWSKTLGVSAVVAGIWVMLI